MHTIQRTQDSQEGMDLEIFSALAIAGVQGRIKGVLSEEELLLERRTGHTLQIKLNVINRMRHHHSSLIPRWLLGIGFVLLYGATRVFVGQPALLMLFAGIAIILTFVLGRRPTLTIDTESGDCHTLFGNDASLMRMCYLIKRLQGGSSLPDAREGLELLEREADYPAISPIEGALTAAGEANIETPGVLEAFLMENSETGAVDLLPEWAAKESGAPVSFTEPTYTERVSEVENTFNPTFPAPFARAENVRQEMRTHQHNPVQAPNPWAQQSSHHSIQNQQNFGHQQPIQAQSTEQSEPTFDGFDMFGAGGLFDDPTPSTQNQNPYGDNQTLHAQQPISNQGYQVENEYPINNAPSSVNAAENQYAQTAVNTGAPQTSSYRMIEQRRNESLNHATGMTDHDGTGAQNIHQRTTGFIPSFLSPLSRGQRQDNLMRFEPEDDNGEPISMQETIAPSGLVAGARKEGEGEIIDAEIVGNEDAKLEQFPHMQRLAEQRSPARRRIRLRKDVLGQHRTSRGIRNLLLPSINRLGQLASDDSNENSNHSVGFQTGESLRLAADQTYQSQITDEIARLTQDNGGVLPDGVAEQLLRHIANSGGDRNLLTAGPEDIPDSFSDLSSSSEIARKERDIPGIERMDKLV